MALTTCNKRGEVVTNRIGEVQCNSISDAQSISNQCLRSFSLIKAQVDDNGVRCDSDLIVPELVLKATSLPLKLTDGVIVPFEDSVSFELSQSAMLEIQINTDDLNLTKEVKDVQFDVQSIKLTGCYSCRIGASLFFTATLECPSVGYFLPIHITSNPTTLQVVMKVDQPDVNLCRCRYPPSLYI